jgi:group I intron endonuclease
MMIIYKAVNRINGRIYVGKTVRSFPYRISRHLNDKRKTAFPAALRKYGLQAFEWSVIDTAEDAQTLNEKERFWIRALNSKAPNGYNLTDGGEGTLGFSSWAKGKHFSAAHRRKISQKRMGHDVSEETRQKLSMSQAGKSGKPLSRETRRKISKALSGRHLTESTKQKLRNARLGTHLSAETKERIRKAMTGRHHSEESKARMSAAQMGHPGSNRGKRFSPEHRGKISKALKGHVISEEIRHKIAATLSHRNKVEREHE